MPDVTATHPRRTQISLYAAVQSGHGSHGEHSQHSGAIMDYFDLGTYSRKVTTTSDAAQIWFDRGLNWLYGFNHQEAIACFVRAAEADPNCAMAFWGASYAAGPNYNLPWHRYDPAGRARTLAASYDFMEQALAVIDHAAPLEAEMIRALQIRYPSRDVPEDPKGMNVWNANYTNRMREIFDANRSDMEVRSVFVESIMNETPWMMWDVDSGGIPENAGTAEAMEVLEEAFANQPESWKCPGLLHLYVHLMEMSPFPERALRQGDVLRTLVPDAGHLVHMPTHLDVLCGHYRDVLIYNQMATEVDNKFLDKEGAMGVYTMYRTHNMHFAVYGAMFLGQYTPAMEAAEMIIEKTPEELLRVESPPMADFLEAYQSMKHHVMIRFGKWQEIVDLPLPSDPELYAATTAVALYAKGVAHSALGNVAEAEATRNAFYEAKARVPEGRRVHNNVMSDILDVAAAMLEGELEYRKGNFDAAFDHLRRSVQLDDDLLYDEPWGWMQPARHALGALLLEQGRVEEAEQVYRADLGLDGSLSRSSQHLENVWALHGLHECLSRRGENVEITMIKQRLDMALSRTEMPIRASCLCRQEAA